MNLPYFFCWRTRKKKLTAGAVTEYKTTFKTYGSMQRLAHLARKYSAWQTSQTSGLVRRVSRFGPVLIM